MGIRTTNDRLAQRVRVDPTDPVDGCWAWLGTTTNHGYAQVRKDNRAHHVHRLIYEMVIGPVPSGLVLDHLCRNRGCVNPRHVEPVTHRENIMRGTVPSANRSRCKAGKHDITGPDAIYTDSDGYERCRACRLESRRRYTQRQQVAA